MRHEHRTLAGAAILASALAVAAPSARAQSRQDMIEHFFGASNISAVAGNGGLSVGISPVGDLAVLTWPSPSYTDQVLHVASNALDVRERPLMMGHEAMGSFVGLVVRTADATQVTWLRDAEWERQQGYGDPEAALVETRFENAGLGLTATVGDYVLPDADVWVRQVELVRTAASPVLDATVIWYSNFAPTLSRVPQLPLADWAFDAYNDFAALYDQGSEAIVHFRPAGHSDLTELGNLLNPRAIDYGEVGEALAATGFDAAAAAALVADLDQLYEPGVYLAVGASAPVAGYQVGFDETPICDVVDQMVDHVLELPEVFPGVTLPLDPSLVEVLRCETTTADIVLQNGWTHPAADAYQDAADGVLSGSPGAAGRVNEALAVPLEFQADTADVAFYVAAADTASGALAGLETARGTPAAQHRADTVAEWRQWLSRARLPGTDDERVLEVCRRALINLRVGMDRETGAIVASISRQAPYGQDWPRDGAFFNAALDIAGYPELVEQHNRFYLETIRTDDEDPELFINDDPPPDPVTGRKVFPAGSWEMNYYADGMVGGNIRFEIDNTGLAVWSLVAHAGFVADETDRLAYLEEVWPVVKAAADLLVHWRDPETGLHAPAHEDDNFAYTQTLHGAVAVYAGLANAARAARALGYSEDAGSYEDRAWELKQAVLTYLYNDDTGYFMEGLEDRTNPGNLPGGSSSWLAWPARLLPFGDERVQRQLRANLDYALAQLDPTDGGGAYLTKILTAAGLGLTDPADRADVEAALHAMVQLVATPDTAILGETFVPIDTDGDGVTDAFSTRVSNPHLWAATLVYLTAMALYDGELFDPHLEVLPALEEPADDRGCGCATPGAPESAALWPLLLLWLLGRARRRRG